MEKSKPNGAAQKLKKTFSLEEKLASCQEWKQSGLSMRQFCKTRKFSASALYQWNHELYPKKIHKEENWLPVKAVQSQKLEMESSVLIELSLPNQSIARIKVSRTEAVSFLQEIYHAASAIR